MALTFALSGVLVGCGAGHTKKSATTAPPRIATRHAVPLKHFRLDELKGDEDDDDVSTMDKASNRPDNDADLDNDSLAKKDKRYRDDDDGLIVTWGHSAVASDAAAVGALVRSYYEAAAKDDGTGGCSLMSSQTAKEVPEDYGSGAGPAYLKGTTCPLVIGKLFVHDRSKFGAPFAVTGIRVKGNEAFALIGSPSQPAGWLKLRREEGTWRLTQLEPTPLP